MITTAQQAIWLLVPALPIALWIAWSDLSTMRITNKSVLLLAAGFVLVGLVALPFGTLLMRLLQMLVVLAIGFALNAGRMIGGGDAKYAAAMAGFFARGDLELVIVLFGAMLMAAFVTHRLARRLGSVRALAPDWKSWSAGKEFPMGLALSGTLIGYLVLAIVF